MTVVLFVHVDCSGCESKIKKALCKLKGVEEVEVDRATQKVTVIGWADQKKVLKAVRKTGRKAVLWPYQSECQYYHQQYQPTAAARRCFRPASGGPAPSSHYNYYVHGYDDFDAVGYHHAGQCSVCGGGGGGSIFSDDNSHGCSVM